ncbi:MAG: hypothetical protein ACF8PN_13745 [Phycisphaerales bacterium]
MPDKPAENAESTGRKLPLKVIIIVVGVVLMEVATIIGVAMFTNTPSVEAREFEIDEAATLNRIVEVPVLKDRFPNSKQGVVYLYETQITAQVRARDQQEIERILTENEARVKTIVSAIWRQAEPRHFNEPELSTLTRQLEEALGEVFGEDPNSNEPRLQGILIPSLTGFRSDF